MALQNSIGIALAVSIAHPANPSEGSDWDGLTFADVSKLTEVPDMTGEFDINTFEDLTTGEEFKLRGILRAGEGEIKLGYDPTDAGQALIETAALTGEKVSLKFTLKSGTKYYRRAVIKSYKPSDASISTVLMVTVSVAFDGVSLKVA